MSLCEYTDIDGPYENLDSENLVEKTIIEGKKSESMSKRLQDVRYLKEWPIWCGCLVKTFLWCQKKVKIILLS